MKPTILSCAVTGSFTTREHNPNLPVTPEEIANECFAAAKSGAAICHIHVREPETGTPSMNIEYYREVVQRIRASSTDLIINLTTGPGGRYVPSDEDPAQAGPSTTLVSPIVRSEHVVELKPEICSLDLNTMWFGGGAVINHPPAVKAMAERIYASGVKPELEVFDVGHVSLANHLVKTGIISDSKPLYQLCLGIPWGAPASPESMTLMRNMLPKDAIWASFGISRYEFPMVATATVLGGHVRVGLEDNLYISRGKLASGNAQLVERAVKIINAIGENVATPSQAREIFGLNEGNDTRKAAE